MLIKFLDESLYPIESNDSKQPWSSISFPKIQKKVSRGISREYQKPEDGLHFISHSKLKKSEDNIESLSMPVLKKSVSSFSDIREDRKVLKIH